MNDDVMQHVHEFAEENELYNGEMSTAEKWEVAHSRIEELVGDLKVSVHYQGEGEMAESLTILVMECLVVSDAVGLDIDEALEQELQYRYAATVDENDKLDADDSVGVPKPDYMELRR